MGDVYAFGRRSDETMHLQQALNRIGIDAGTPDGIFGRQTKGAVEAAQARFGLVATGRPDKALLVSLGLMDAPTIPKLSLSTLIGLIGPVSALLKGKPMTSDQITGIVRAVLAAVFGYITGKGWLDANTAATISGAVLTLLVAVWSVYSNRAKTIVPIKDK